MNSRNMGRESQIVFSQHFFSLGLIMIVMLMGVGLSTIVVFGAEQRTPASPYLVKDINIATEPSDPMRLVDVGGVLFFVADDGVHGLELWKRVVEK